MIKALIFDCFGVLATDIWLAFIDSLPPEIDKEKAGQFNKAFDKGLITQQEYIDGVKELTGQEPPVLDSAPVAKNTALLGFIEQLKSDYKIGILSNVSSTWITDEFLTKSEAELFDAIVLSYETGMIKPDPRLYQLACERLGVEPEESIMIDDRLAYVDGARDAGLGGLVYTDLHTFKTELNQLLNMNY